MIYRYVLFVFFGVYLILSGFISGLPRYPNIKLDGRVVFDAYISTILYAGDRYLSSNLELIRLLSTGVEYGWADIDYLARSSQEISKLNPCHEDNYYLSNGLLTWAGSDETSNSVLKSAMECRAWDDIPAFFYGFNQAFFSRDMTSAVNALEVAAERNYMNEASYRKLAIMLQVDEIADEKLALDFLWAQRSATNDSKLQAMLDKRIERMEGLALLRQKARKYAELNGELASIEDLVEQGFLEKIPEDPLKIGYDLMDGKVVLRRVTLPGIGELP